MIGKPVVDDICEQKQKLYLESDKIPDYFSVEFHLGFI